MSNGSQARQTPAKPSRCSQQPATKNGGNARPTTAPPIHHRRQRRSSPARKSATINPNVSANSVVNALTSRLFLSSVQFMSNPRHQKHSLESCRIRQCREPYGSLLDGATGFPSPLPSPAGRGNRWRAIRAFPAVVWHALHLVLRKCREEFSLSPGERTCLAIHTPDTS